ncbi:SDR family oxidoreductase [Rhodobacteraceae bacterium CH30]|nr:SDR family oxidoreductase [Rhodobacteraceae bacterium CH30]
MRVLIIGASGMLGSTLFRTLSANENLNVFGTIRDSRVTRYFSQKLRDSLIPNISVEGESGLLTAFSIVKPDIVLNCVGIIKQLPNSHDHLTSLAINASLPHRLAKYSKTVGARFIHFSTDCVFSGKTGMYHENDFPDAYDLYGRTKLLGEVDYENTLTLRTSIIGHELTSSKSLVDWFISQSIETKGYRKAIFSGLPTIEVARVINDFVIPNSDLKGLYHLSVNPINKYELLTLIAETYKKDIHIIPDDQVIIDRSLNSDRFRIATEFEPKSWSELIREMHDDYMSCQA